jgi:hypothetical protein
MRTISMAEYIRESLPVKRIETICHSLGISGIGEGHLVDNQTMVELTDAGQVISVGGQPVKAVELDKAVEEVEVVPDAPDDEEDEPKPKKSRKKEASE